MNTKFFKYIIPEEDDRSGQKHNTGLIAGF